MVGGFPVFGVRLVLRPDRLAAEGKDAHVTADETTKPTHPKASQGERARRPRSQHAIAGVRRSMEADEFEKPPSSFVVERRFGVGVRSFGDSPSALACLRSETPPSFLEAPTFRTFDRRVEDPPSRRRVAERPTTFEVSR